MTDLHCLGCGVALRIVTADPAYDEAANDAIVRLEMAEDAAEAYRDGSVRRGVQPDGECPRCHVILHPIADPDRNIPDGGPEWTLVLA